MVIINDPYQQMIIIIINGRVVNEYRPLVQPPSVCAGATGVLRHGFGHALPELVEKASGAARPTVGETHTATVVMCDTWQP